MPVDDRALGHARIHIGHANQHADAAIGQLLGPLDLIQIFRGVVVDRGPQQVAQVLRARSGGQVGMRLNGGQFGFGSVGKIRLKTVLDHRGMSGGNKIEVQWIAVVHVEDAPC